jgi:serine/threonine protein kinase
VRTRCSCGGSAAAASERSDSTGAKRACVKTASASDGAAADAKSLMLALVANGPAGSCESASSVVSEDSGGGSTAGMQASDLFEIFEDSDTVAPAGGVKTWVDIVFDNLCLNGQVDLAVVLRWRRVSREWRGALNHALPLLRQVSFPVGVTLEGHYQILKQLGEGAYGFEPGDEKQTYELAKADAKEKASGSKVVIKRIKDAIEDQEQDSVWDTDDVFVPGKLLLRELKLLRHFRGHENVIGITDIQENPRGQDRFKDIYIVTDRMDAGLDCIIRSSQPFSDDHVKYFTYQILRGLKYIHSANVMHRDLRPQNLLVNANCDLKICGLGLARPSAVMIFSPSWGKKVAVIAKWYRAPEMVMGKKDCDKYDKSIDMWAVGCILAELLLRKPLFPGGDWLDMIQRQVAFLGNPPVEDQKHVSERVKTFFARFTKVQNPGLKTVFPNASGPALDLLDRLLQFNPLKRLNAEQALAHPYMAELHNPEDEPKCEAEFEFNYETKDNLTEARIREMVFHEIKQYHNPMGKPRPKG